MREPRAFGLRPAQIFRWVRYAERARLIRLILIKCGVTLELAREASFALANELKFLPETRMKRATPPAPEYDARAPPIDPLDAARMLISRCCGALRETVIEHQLEIFRRMLPEEMQKGKKYARRPISACSVCLPCGCDRRRPLYHRKKPARGRAGVCGTRLGPSRGRLRSLILTSM